MKKRNSAGILRQRAKNRLKEKYSSIEIPSSQEGIERMIYELELQKMELELQNEALLESKTILDNSSDLMGLVKLNENNEFIFKAINKTGADTLESSNIVIDEMYYGAELKQYTQDFLGFSEEEALNHENNYREAIKSNKAFSTEMLLEKDGEMHCYETIVSPVENKGGETLEFVWCTRDITERKTVEQAQADSQKKQQQFEAITQQASEAITIADLEGNYTFVNTAFCDMMGYSKEELLTMTVFDMKLNPEEKHIFKAAKDGRTVGELKLLRKDGLDFLARVSGKSIYVGEEKFVLGIITDITEERAREEEQKKSKEQFEKLFDLSPDFMFKTNIHTLQFEAVNQRVIDNYGYTREEFLELSVFDIEADSSSLDLGKKHDENLGIGEVVEIEGLHKRKDQTTFLASIRICRLDEHFVITTVRDITEQKQMEEKLRYAKETFELAINGTSAGIWDWVDVNSEKLWWSPQLYHLLGYEVNEVPISLSLFRELLLPAHRDLVFDLVEKHLLENIPYDIEYQLKTKSGTYKWFRATGQAKRDDNGKAVRMVGSIVDIEQRKQIEAQNKHYQYLLEQSQENAHIGTWELDLVNDVTIWTKENYRILDIPLDVFPTFDLFINQVHPEDRDFVTKEWLAVLEQAAAYNIEYRLLVDNHVKWVRSKAIINYDLEGRAQTIVGLTQEITKFKEIENELRLSRDYLRKGAEISQIGFWKHSLKLKETEFTKEFEKIYEFTKSFSWEEVTKRIHPKDVDECLMVINESIEKGSSWKIIHRILFDDGRIKWIKGIGEPVFDETGQVEFLVGVIQDITNQKITELEIETAKNSYQNLFDLSPDFMFKSRMDNFQFVTVNQRACEFYGYTKEEFEKLTILDIQANPKRTKYDHIPVGEVIEIEVYHKKKDGTEFPVYVSFCKLDDEFILATARDITVRKKATKEADDLKYALDEASMVAVTDRFGRIISVNTRFCNISKYASQELIGKTHRVVNSGYHSKAFWENVWATIKGGNVWVGEIKNKAKDGSFYWTQSSIIPFLDEKGVPFQYIAIRTDITEQKALEKELRAAKEDADKNARIKENFLANMSHEIRTPMNGVLGFSRLLLQTSMNNVQKKYADSIHSSAENLLVVINDILDVSKMESGKFEIKNSEFNLEKRIRSTLKILQVALDEKGLDLLVEIDNKIPSCIIAAPNRIAQVLINLVNNAIKFTDQGKVHLKVHLQEENLLLFEVIDTGIGIHKDKWETIFDSFIQVENYTTREYGGSGLGLSISKELVQLMGGEIGLSSEVGQGSTFYFTIPFEFCTCTDVCKSDSPVFDEGILLEPLDVSDRVKVLVVEDHPVNQELAMIFLDLLDCSYELVENGEEAVNKAIEGGFDLVLMDIQMPKMDGIEATKQIRTFDKVTPIVAMTAHALEKEKQGCLDIGMNDYLTKPFKLETLQELIIKYAKKQKPNIKLSAEPLIKKTTDTSIFSQVLHEMGGDQNIVNDLLSIFKIEIVKFVDEMRVAIDLQDMKQIKELRHKIRPGLDLFKFTVQKEHILTISHLMEEQAEPKEIQYHFQELEKSVSILLEEIDIEMQKGLN